MSRDRSSPRRSTRSDSDRPNRQTLQAVAPGDALEQGIQPRPLVAPLGATDALVAEYSHHGPAKPSSGLLKRLLLVLNGLAAITGRDPDVERGASECCHNGSVARIGCSSSNDRGA